MQHLFFIKNGDLLTNIFFQTYHIKNTQFYGFPHFDENNHTRDSSIPLDTSSIIR
jgi:hypothetical protein